MAKAFAEIWISHKGNVLSSREYDILPRPTIKCSFELEIRFNMFALVWLAPFIWCMASYLIIQIPMHFETARQNLGQTICLRVASTFRLCGFFHRSQNIYIILVRIRDVDAHTCIIRWNAWFTWSLILSDRKRTNGKPARDEKLARLSGSLELIVLHTHDTPFCFDVFTVCVAESCFWTTAEQQQQR